MELNELYNKISPYIVSLTAIKKIKGIDYMVGNGTGFLTGDGYLITNFHVMEKVLLGLQEGEEYSLLIGQSERRKFSLPVTTAIETYHDGRVEYRTEKQDFIFGIYTLNSSRIKACITGYSSEENCNDYIILNPEMKLVSTPKDKIKEIDIGGQKIPISDPSDGKQSPLIEFLKDNEVYVGQEVCIFG